MVEERSGPLLQLSWVTNQVCDLLLPESPSLPSFSMSVQKEKVHSKERDQLRQWIKTEPKPFCYVEPRGQVYLRNEVDDDVVIHWTSEWTSV